MNSVIVLGGGGHALVVIDTLRAMGRTVAGYLAPQPGDPVAGAAWLGDDSHLDGLDPAAVELALGLGAVRPSPLRRHLFEGLKMRGFRFATLVHPTAVVAPGVELGEGAQIMAGAVLQPGVTIGANAIVNTRAAIDHDCRVGDHAHIATGAALSGTVRVGEGAHVGTGAAIIQGITLGPGALVAAGAAVVRDVAAGSRVAGVPARPMEGKQA